MNSSFKLIMCIIKDLLTLPSDLTFKEKLVKNEKLLKEYEEALKEWLYTNRGRCTHQASDKTILWYMEQIGTTKYNIGFYNAAIACGRS